MHTILGLHHLCIVKQTELADNNHTTQLLIIIQVQDQLINIFLGHFYNTYIFFLLDDSTSSTLSEDLTVLQLEVICDRLFDSQL